MGRSYVCLTLQGLISPPGRGRSIEIPCEGTIPATSLSTEDSDSSAGGDIDGERKVLEKLLPNRAFVAVAWVLSLSHEAASNCRAAPTGRGLFAELEKRVSRC